MNKARSILVPIFLFMVAFFVTGCAQRVRTVASAPEPPTPVQKEAIQQALLHDTSEEGNGKVIQLELEQIALDSSYALTTWTRGEMGGQALLRWDSGSWHVLARESGWLGARALGREGVPDPVAKSLLDQLDPNWPSYERF